MSSSLSLSFDTPDPDDLHARVEARAAYWIDRAREITGASARRLPVPEVRFDLRGRAAGQAVFARRSRRCHVRINADLLASHPREMLDETVPHEIAHVVVYRLYGTRAKPHGREWQSLMQAFGVDASPCHALPAEPVRRLKQYRYVCGCDEPAWLTSIRHKRACNGTAYRCRRCGQELAHAPDNETAG
ncbi:SprT-like domain-containing protein [Salinisphaera sp. Q1T1-3]|uniref:SprT family zinc-dependent metalloprotease n=1 Tax=Salinisphaera sp. Q1T1-3 TaxID=2321229 RepID=UPI000E763770|nr:SprT-like domain-containing protein [Salinisphaera sp. Q1T1-3]RJS94463.1 hypothetical protein D3260_05050 [Salinisphaera sp. Q1T1-3]